MKRTLTVSLWLAMAALPAACQPARRPAETASTPPAPCATGSPPQASAAPSSSSTPGEKVLASSSRADDPRRPIRLAWARYLVAIHNRIHPVFADGVLVSLDRLPPDDPQNNPSLAANVELELEPEHGKIVRMTLLRASGVAAFDAAVLRALEQAAGSEGFGKAPAEAIAREGTVRLTWQFHRPRNEACSTINARPLSFATPLPASSSAPLAHPATPDAAPPAAPASGRSLPSAPPMTSPQPYPW